MPLPGDFAKNNWLSGDTIGPTYQVLNDIGDSIRTRWADLNMNTYALTACGDVTFAAGKKILQDAWTLVTPAGWTGGFYYRLDKDGYVSVKLALAGRVITSGELIWTFPAGLHPPFECNFFCSVSNTQSDEIYVAADGSMRIRGPVLSTTWVIGNFRFPIS